VTLNGRTIKDDEFDIDVEEGEAAAASRARPA
jgi:hypothetical protein